MSEAPQETVVKNHCTRSTRQTLTTQEKFLAHKIDTTIEVSRAERDMPLQQINSDSKNTCIKRLVDAAPKLTREQTIRIRSALGGGF